MKQKQCFKRQQPRAFQKRLKDILEAVGNLSRNKKKSAPRYITVKLFKTKDKTKTIIRAAQSKQREVAIKGVTVGLTDDF